uniref:Uncharacterized protein n=1 Tax=Caenorhabditis tropicalis TaxID=1561998 RepID=A0A1I7UCF4_9PELO
MANENQQKDLKTKASLFEYDDNGLDAEWSFNLEESIIQSEIDNNQSDHRVHDDETVIVDRCFYEDLIATCDALKAQMNDLEGIIEKKQKKYEEAEKRMKELEEKSEKLKKENKELLEKMTKKEEEANVKIDSMKVEIHSLTTQIQSKDDKINTINSKYYELKKRGLQMLEQKEKDISKMREAMTEQNDKLKATESMAKLERERRKKLENEVMGANKMIKEALREEKISRKIAERECLNEKTENMALREKVNEMSSRGVVVLNDCPVFEHSILSQRIDVLERQRDILVNSINERDSRKK